MHPDMLRQLAAEHVRDLITEAGAARRAMMRLARRHRRPAHLRPAPPPYMRSGSGPGPKTLAGADDRVEASGKLSAMRAVNAEPVISAASARIPRTRLRQQETVHQWLLTSRRWTPPTRRAHRQRTGTARGHPHPDRIRHTGASRPGGRAIQNCPPL
jgi:hypothetical protein